MLERLAGNAPLKAAFAEMRRSGRVPHTILLAGEPGLGTGFAARCIAADLLYPEGGAMAEALVAGQCCHALAKTGRRDSGYIETGVVRDAVEVRGLGQNGSYWIGQVIAARGEIFHSSLSGAGRVLLLYHAEAMNPESANALLKVLEEPPEGVTFLLTASSPAAVLATIRSRCISFSLAPVSAEECSAAVRARGVDDKTARLYSALFDGRIGAVLAAAQNEKRRAAVEKAQALAQAMARRDAYAAGVLLAPMDRDRDAVLTLLDDFSALAAAVLRQPGLCPLSPEAAVRAVRAAEAARVRVLAYGNLRLILTLLAMQLGKG